MADVVVLRAVLTGDHSGLTQSIQEGHHIIEAFGKEVFDGPTMRVRVDTREAEKSLAQGQPSGSPSSPRTPRPSTQNPDKVAKTTAAAVEQIEKTSQARQTAIAEEGESKRASIAVQGTQRRANQEAQANARQEAQERAHLQRLIQDKDRAEQRLARRPRMTMEQRADRNSAIGSALNTTGNDLTMGVTAPVAAGVGLTLREGIKWQSDFAGVKKSVDGSPTQLRGLELSLRDMAAGKQAIPIQTEELAKIAENAGQLGISGTKHVADFTKTMAMLGTTTNMSSDQAATSLARIDNILGTNQQSFDRYGSALVDLGKHGASTESEITEMSQRLAGEAKQIGLSAPQVLAFGSSLSSVGVEAEAGGTAFSMFWKNVDAAVRNGGKSLDDMAKVAGMSGAQFKKAWQTDAAGATLAFVEGLAKIKAAGGSAAGTLDSLGMKEQRLHDSLLRLAGATGTVSDLRNSLQISSSAWEKNTALTIEAGKRYETTASQLQILQNRLREVAIQASEAVLPGVNKELKGFSAGIPDDAQKAAAAYEALGPAGQNAVIGLVGIGVASGPILKVAGNVFTLVGALGKLAKWVLPTTVVESLAPLGAIIANPLVGIPLLVLALGGGAIAWENYIAKVEDAVTAQHNAKMSAESLAEILARAQKYAGGSAATKSALGKLQEEAAAAGQDTGKLISLIKKATDAKVAVGKDMKLDPIGKNAVQNELQRLINNLSSQVVTLNVDINTGEVSTALKVAIDRAKGNVTTATKAQDVSDVTPERAKAAGLPLPTAPKKPVATDYQEIGPAGIVLSFDSNKFDRDKKKFITDEAAYEKELATRKQQVLDIEKAQHDEERKNGVAATQTTKNQTAALTEQTQAVEKLTNKELAHEKARLETMAKAGKLPLGAPEYPRSLEVKDESEKRAKLAKDKSDKAKANRALEEGQRKADAEANAKAAALKQRQIDEALADQRRDQDQRTDEQKLTQWTGANQAIEGTLGRIAGLAEQGAQATGEQSKATAEAKAQAETLRDEWDGIPQAIKDGYIELAGLETELSKLNRLSEGLRQNFDGIADGLSDADFSKFSAFVSKVEGSLNLGGQRTALINRANDVAGNTLPVIASVQKGLRDRMDTRQLAARKPFDDPKNPNDGNLVSVARQMVGQTGANAQVAGKAYGDEWCVGFVQSVRKNAGLPELANGTVGVRALRKWASNTGRVTNDPQAGDVMTIDRTGTRHAAIVASRVGNQVTTIGGNEGAKNNFASKVKEGATYNINAPGMMFIRAEDTARTSKSAAAAKVVATAATDAPTSDTTTASGPSVPNFKQNGDLLNRLRLPGSFGGSMAQYRPRDGESTSYRQTMEAQLREVLKAADELKPQKDGTMRARFGKNWETVSPWDWRQEGTRLDASKTAFDTRTGGINQIRDMRRETAQRAATAQTPGEYGALLQSMNQGGFKGNTSSERQEILARTAGAIMAEATAANKQFTKSEQDKAAVLAAGRPFLQGANTDLAAYARALAMAEEKQAAMARYQGMTDNAKAAAAKAAELEAAARKRPNPGTLIDPEGMAARQKIQGFKDQAAGFLAQRDGLVAGDVAAAGKTFDATALQEAQKALDATLVQRKQNIELLRFQNKLLADGKLSQEGIAEATEHEKTYREELKKLTDSVPKDQITPAQTKDFERRAKEAADKERAENREKKKGDNLGADQAALLDSQRQIALLQEKLRLTQQYPSQSPQLSFESRMADARASVEGSLKEYQNSKGELSPKGKEIYGKRVGEEEGKIRAQMAVELGETEVRAVEDAKTATLSAQRDVLESTRNNLTERLAVEKWFENESRKVRGLPLMSKDEEAEFNKKGDWEKQGEIQNRSRQQAQELSGIFQDGITEGMHKGFLSGLAAIGQELQQSILRKEIAAASDRLAGVPRDPSASTGSSFLDQVFGRNRPQTPMLPNTETATGPRNSVLGLPAAGPPIFTPPFMPQVGQNAVVRNDAVAAASAAVSVLGGGKESKHGGTMNVANLKVITPHTAIDSRSTSVNSRGPVNGGGGSGSTKSLDQLTDLASIMT